MTNHSNIHGIPAYLFTVLEIVGFSAISFILGICWDRACRRRRGIDIN